MSRTRPPAVLMALTVAVAVWGLAAVAPPAASQTGSADLSLTKSGPATVTVGSDVSRGSPSVGRRWQQRSV